MKIVRLSLNNQQTEPIAGEISAECQLMFFRTPVIYRINGKEIPFNGSSAILYSGGFRREIRPASSGGLKYDSVAFIALNTDKQYAEAMSLTFDSPIEISSDNLISDIFRSMNAYMLRKSLRQSEFLELSMRLLFISLSDEKNKLPIDEYETIPKYAELKALHEEIFDSPMTNWSAEEMSEDIGVSKAYFHRLYLSAFGVTCHQDVIKSRMNYAAKLLRNTDMSVSVIAEKCGYFNDAYFMRQFKQHNGCTPTEYRRRSKANNSSRSKL